VKLEEMRARAVDFAVRLKAVKDETEAPWWGWYPFEILPAFLDNLDQLLTGENRRLLEDPVDTRIADIGAADGDLAFFLETIGFQVDIFDGGPESVRDLRLLAPRRLKEALGSTGEIYPIDLDHDFTLPRSYNLVFCLGVFYHLRNPMLALEALARSARHCIISTKVARYVRVPRRAGARRVDISALPMAYLLDTNEVSETDTSNYWVFSDCGLRRMVGRAGWTVLDMITLGNPGAEPARTSEARAWCLLRSDRFEQP
jgi:SAM-dependent methyltransferase